MLTNSFNFVNIFVFVFVCVKRRKTFKYITGILIFYFINVTHNFVLIQVVGVALVDTVEHSFALCEFSDDDYFSNLEALVVQLGPKECIIPSESNLEFENVKKVNAMFVVRNFVCNESSVYKDV